MLQPVTLACALVLLTMTAAHAQATRVRRVTVAASPKEPLPELRVAAGVKTTILLDARVDEHSVQVDATRVKLLDVRERSLSLETLVTPGEKEQWEVRFRYADGGQPEWAAFALVAHPTEVDVQVEAVRQRQTLGDCQEQLAAAKARGEGPRAEVWALADRLAGKPVQAEVLRVRGAKGVAYRLGDGVLVVLQLVKAEGQPPWGPTVATLRSVDSPNEQVKVRALHVREGPLAPGAWSTLAVEAELPSAAAGRRFTLELRDASGRSRKVSRIQLPPTQGQAGSGR